VSGLQQIARISIQGREYPVLVRRTRYGVALKLAGGPPRGGPLLNSDSEHLAEHPEKAAALLRGEVVKC
jgi:hypothetical protein